MKTEIVKGKEPGPRAPEVGEAFAYDGEVYIRIPDGRGRKAFGLADGSTGEPTGKPAAGKLFAVCLGSGSVDWWSGGFDTRSVTLLEPEGGALRFVKKGTAP